ncbi:hypothetical protein BH10PSE14_BH10PSE14_36790 [soil metagenome]
MIFNQTAFAVGTLIARKEKVTGKAAIQAGLLMSIGGTAPTGIVLAQSSIRSARRRQRASELGTAGGEGVSPLPPTPQSTPTASGTPSWPTPTPSTGITADEMKAGIAEAFAQFGKQMDAQNAKLLAAIAALAASIDAQTAAGTTPKKSAS